MKVLVVDSDWDRVTHICRVFRDAKAKIASSPGVQSTFLHQSAVTSHAFRKALSDGTPDFVSAVGHGKFDRFEGYGGAVLWEVGKIQKAEVEGRMIHLLSCKTAAELGSEIVKLGAKLFAGYREDWWIVPEMGNKKIWKASDSDLLGDRLLNTFMEIATEVDRLILQQLPVNELSAKIVDMYEEAIDYWETREGENNMVAFALARLNWNKQFFAIYS